MSEIPELPVPEFYDPAHAGRFDYSPDQHRLLGEATRWRRLHGLRPAAEDRRRVVLLLIDEQKDFCFPEGSLFVGGRSGRGAIVDSDRVARFVHRNLGTITEVVCTMDTHDPFQVFFASFWVDAAGEPLSPHREVTAEDVRAGRARPHPALAAPLAGGDLGWLTRQALFYCEELERRGRYRLYLWPPHCLLGSAGHALAGVVHEARLFHAFARLAPDPVETKGAHPLTENYSALSPEVLLRHDGPPLASRNEGLVRRLVAADAVIVAGQAASHCVAATVDDLLAAVRAADPARAGRVYLLRDCMSAVAVPDPARPGRFLADFTPQAEAALARFQEAGMHVVRSSEPVASWPGFTGA